MSSRSGAASPRGSKEPSAPPLQLYLSDPGRAAVEFGLLLGALPLSKALPTGDGHPVLVLPGLMAGDDSTIPLRKFLEGRGYKVRGWELGLNRGLRDGVQGHLLDLVRDFSDM